jgi:hypothetical protein
MEEVSLVCGNCSEETFRPAKEPPKNAREAKQALFHCEHCGAINLRDGTVRVKKVQEVREIPEQKQERGPSAGKVILGALVAVVAAIFLGKFIKGQGGSSGNSPKSTGQDHKSPWSPIG